MARKFFDVTQTWGAGRLDPLGPDEDAADLSAILSWIRATRIAVELDPARKPPNIARAVLTTYWQEPRSKFHEDNLNGHRKDELGNKLTLVPWSVEAFDQYRQSGSRAGLITEHVTPIQAMWEKLGSLLDSAEDDEQWMGEARIYLQVNFVIAIITQQQAGAIDTLMKTGATEGAPFERYRRAAEHIRQLRDAGTTDVMLDITQFVHPAFVDPPEAAEALVEEDAELAQTDVVDVVNSVDDTGLS